TGADRVHSDAGRAEPPVPKLHLRRDGKVGKADGPLPVHLFGGGGGRLRPKLPKGSSSMVKLAGVFGKISPFRALVLGDFLLDTYTTGRVKRVSPEAPVPILEVVKHEMRAGGAGNVVLNLLALGAEVYAAGRVGLDPEGAA